MLTNRADGRAFAPTSGAAAGAGARRLNPHATLEPRSANPSASRVETPRIESPPIKKPLNLEVLSRNVRNYRLQRRPIQVRSVGGPDCRHLVRSKLNLLPSQHLLIKPQRMTHPRKRCVTSGRSEEALELNRRRVGCQGELSTEGLAQQSCRRTDIPRLRQKLGQLRMISRLLTPKRRPVEGALQGRKLLRVSLRPFEAATEHLLGAGGPNCGCGHQDRADSRLDGDAVQRLPNTKAINLSGAQGIDQKRRRYDNHSHVSIGIDTTRGQPVPQLVVVT